MGAAADSVGLDDADADDGLTTRTGLLFEARAY